MESNLRIGRAIVGIGGRDGLRLTGQGRLEGGAYPLLVCRRTGNIYLQDVELKARGDATAALTLRECRGLAFNNVQFQDFAPGSLELTGTTDVVVANGRLP